MLGRMRIARRGDRHRAAVDADTRRASISLMPKEARKRSCWPMPCSPAIAEDLALVQREARVLQLLARR